MTLQAQRNVQEPVFGPYDSRRFGRSLGVNPLPAGARLCNFDCIYCECATSAWPLQWELKPDFPTAEQIRDGLIAAAEVFSSTDLDSITIAGNGEPTLAPHLDEIVDVVTECRDRDWPNARTVILTNGTTCHKPSVRAALAKLDCRVVKLDAGTNWTFDELNRPSGKFCMTELVRRISLLPDIVIQSMFVHGPVDNTNAHEVGAWTEWLAQLAPQSVQIYSLDRVPAKSWVRAVPRVELEVIASYVESHAGIPTQVF
ncbi:MAG TPA: radical SAM protein [Terriglobia bacterium]|nr:radical SAM protein [Terriglobia bacterium]